MKRKYEHFDAESTPRISISATAWKRRARLQRLKSIHWSVNLILACLVLSDTTAVRAQYCAAAPQQFLAWWKGQDDAADSAGIHHGSLIGNATYVQGKVGRAFLLDGTGDYISIPSDSDWNLESDFSIVMWSRFSVLKNCVLIHRDPLGFELYYNHTLGQLFFGPNPPSPPVISGAWTPNTNRWYHVAVTRSDVGYRLYIDGTRIAETATNTSPNTAAGGLRIGGYAHAVGWDMNGRIDDVLIVGRALNDCEVNQLFVADSAGICPSPPPADLAQGLVGHWTFDGQNAQDNTGNSNHGAISGAPSFVAGISGLALELDGIDDHVLVEDDPTLNPTNAITVAAWYRPTSFAGGGNDPIVHKPYTALASPFYQYHLGVTGDLFMNVNGDRAAFGFDTSIEGDWNFVYSHSSMWKAGTWYHLAATYDGSFVRLFVNGLLVDSRAKEGSISSYTTDISFGKNFQTGTHLAGAVDEVRIYNRALSPPEVEALFASAATEPACIPTASEWGIITMVLTLGCAGCVIANRRVGLA